MCAVKGRAFPPVENEGVLQQVHRGERVSTQSWEDEVQIAAHPLPANNMPSELLNESVHDPNRDQTSKCVLQQKIIKI